jgi:hypothetical protein
VNIKTGGDKPNARRLRCAAAVVSKILSAAVVRRNQNVGVRAALTKCRKHTKDARNHGIRESKRRKISLVI